MVSKKRVQNSFVGNPVLRISADEGKEDLWGKRDRGLGGGGGGGVLGFWVVFGGFFVLGWVGHNGGKGGLRPSSWAWSRPHTAQIEGKKRSKRENSWGS